MKTKHLISVIALLLFTSCAQLTPEALRGFAAVGTGVALQYAVPKAQKASVAANINAAGNLYTQFSNGAVPTPAQLTLALNTYLPSNETKALTISTIVGIYGGYYPQFKDEAPTEQLDYLTNFLLGARDGAAPFVAPPP